MTGVHTKNVKDGRKIAMENAIRNTIAAFAKHNNAGNTGKM